METHDIVIVGGGLAGLTAGLFAARHGRSTLVLVADVPGGRLISVERIEDFPGFPDGVAGYDLCPMVQEQAANQGAAFQMATTQRLEPEDQTWRVVTDVGDVMARAVIVATGSRPRRLGVPGEERLTGRGVSHCASCDGPMLRGKTAAVVGGGDSAAQEALTLAAHAERVVLLHRRATLSAQQVYQRRITNQPRIEVCPETVVEEILGTETVSGLRTRRLPTGEVNDLVVAGIFVYAGQAPNTSFLHGLLPLTESGHIPTDAWLRTAMPGLFAAGDVREHAAAQAVASAGDGATAAIAAHRYLDGRD